MRPTGPGGAPRAGESARAGLGPYQLSARELATVRALLDYDSWQALDRHGFEGQEAVATAADVVNAWLARR